MLSHPRIIFLFLILITASSCATRGIPLSQQAPTFSKNEYIKIGSNDGRSVYVSKNISNISSNAINSLLEGSNQDYLLTETSDKNSFLLKERNPAAGRKTIVIMGNSSSPTLVESSTSQKNNSVLINDSGGFYSNQVNKKNINTNYPE